MSTELLDHLLDDASLFPPGNAAMPAAVAQHRSVKLGDHGWLVGRFVCPASRLAELVAELQPTDAFALAVVVDTGVAGVPTALAEAGRDARLHLLALELALPADSDPVFAAREALLVLPPDVRCYLELPRIGDWPEALSVIAQAGHGAKLRTGGPQAAAFPTEQEVADFLVACVTIGAPFKCTAGLHHAVRHTDPSTGFDHHGFLNMALAVCAALRGEDPVPVLSERDPTRVAGAVRDLDEATARRARAFYGGFGTCSIDDPVADLTRLGLIPGN